MISESESSSDESEAGRSIGGFGSGRKSPQPVRERLQASHRVPSVNVESVDPTASLNVTTFRKIGQRSKSPSPGPPAAGSLDRESSGSTASLDTDYIMVNRSGGKGSLTKWKTLEAAESFDDGWEEVSLMGSSINRSSTFERSQLYLLVARCISYPFTAKYTIENTPPKQKLTEDKLGAIVRTLNSVLAGERLRNQDNIFTPAELRLCKDESFMATLRWYVEVVLQRGDVVQATRNGSYSAKELVAIFRIRASKHLTYSSATGTLSNEDLSHWMNTYRKLVERVSRAFSLDNTPSHLEPTSADLTAPNPDKLYRLFQKILKVRNVEHQILYKECQLGNSEEQEAVVRRELRDRKRELDDTSVKLGGFGSSMLESIYREEQLKMLKVLNGNLDKLSLSGQPVHSPHAPRKNKAAGTVVNRSGSLSISSQDLQFKLKVTVTIHELTGIPSSESRKLFCVFEMEGGNDQLGTKEVQPTHGSVQFVQAGEFWSASPLPQIKLSILAATKGLLSKKTTLGKRTHVALPSSSEMPTTIEFTKSDKSSENIGRLRISTMVERPPTMKKYGYLWACGDYLFKENKRRFFALIQLSQYKFILTNYSPGAAQPKITIIVDSSYCVEYPTQEDERLASGDSALFVLVSEESEVGRIRFGCRDSADRDSWIKWLARATGQTDTPTPLEAIQDPGSSDLDSYGLQEVVDSVKDITRIDPQKMFEYLFASTLHFRLAEDSFSRGLFSPAQLYVLQEFCARYGVRELYHHLTCLKMWLDQEERGVAIWPVMMLSSFRFCQMHIGGANEDGVAVQIPESPTDLATETEFEFEKLSRFDQSSWPHSLSLTPGHLEQSTWYINQPSKRPTGRYLWKTPSMRLKGLSYDPCPIEKSVIVTTSEKQAFQERCSQLEDILYRKVQYFHSSFPYGLPRDDLKHTLKLLDTVLTANQTAGQAGSLSPNKLLTIVMEKAALVNYKRVFSALGVTDDSVPLSMAQLSCLAQLCIEFMYELHDYYWEDFSQYIQVFSAHLEAFWLFFLVDAREAMYQDDSIVAKLQLFHMVNQYFCSQPTLQMGRFHHAFLTDFTLIVTLYIESLDEQLQLDLRQSFTAETWLPVGECCQAVEGVVRALLSFRGFIDELGWPERTFATQLESRVAGICAKRFHEAACVVEGEMRSNMAARSVVYSYRLPEQLLSMINTLVYLQTQVPQLCPQHLLTSSQSEATPTDIDEYLALLLHQSVTIVTEGLCQPMKLLLGRLTGHDPSDDLLTSLRRMLPHSVPIDSLSQFLSANLKLLTQHIAPSLLGNFLLDWYEGQLALVKAWLDERPNFSLQALQHQSLVSLMEVVRREFSEHQLPQHQLDSETHSAIEHRLSMETSFVDLKTVGSH